MTRKEAKFQNASRRMQKSTERGGLKTKGEVVHIQPFLTPYGVELWYDNHAAVAESQNPSLITKIMTNLSKLCGFANPVTKNDTKK